MVVGAFPLPSSVSGCPSDQQANSKSNQAGARRSEFFKTYICLPPAQVYHWVEMRAKMRIMGFRGAAIKPLNEDAAAELGAELLGETLVFLIGGGCLVAEYSRQTSNNRRKEEELDSRLASMEAEITRLGLLTEELDARARGAERQQLAK
ncbi:hypothetical protein GDO86_015521 [Hymenochirus boettgeri]|uniref:Optic atrophy 3 n=1 Tax=Hymenochirus boettgeri TaxID=247094 RepID=A0A8T2JT95_9PIPI|nr:hypothetical protein GDO86_015521 [Hymenochirus boettgeri]